jgi:FKBP-type peptidyl-prolyl cis-trans isomerase
MSEQVQTAERTPTAGETAANARRRGQAIAGAAAGAAVVAVLVAVFVGIQLSGDDKPAASSAPAASAPAAAAPDAIEPSAAAPSQPPAQAPPANVDPALQKPPVLKAGGSGKLTKLVIKPLIKGTGPKVKTGQTLTVNYVLGKYADGKKIESSWDSGQPVQFPIGVGQLIKGWDQGLPGQTVGSRLQLDVPAALAYGAAQGDLRFVVDILAAQ